MRVSERLERSSTITIKGQVTLPVEIRRVLGVGPHDRVAFVVEEDGVRVRRSRDVVTRTAGTLKGYGPPEALSPAEERRLFEEGVAHDELEALDRSR